MDNSVSLCHPLAIEFTNKLRGLVKEVINMNKNQEKQEEKQVTVKLGASQIPYLLGAARLGIWAESWCATYSQTEFGSYDTHSRRWILQVGYIIKQIKKQTGIKKENKEYGDKETLGLIEKLVQKQCQKNVKNFEKIEKGWLTEE